MRILLLLFALLGITSLKSPGMCCSWSEETEDKIINTLVIDRKDHSFQTLEKYKHKKQWACNIEHNPNNCIEVIDTGIIYFTDGSHGSHVWNIQSNKAGTAVVKLTRTKKNQVVEEQLVNVTVTE